VEEIDKRTRHTWRLSASEGVVITDIEPESQLASIGVEPGDVIRRLNRTDITGIDIFRQAVLDGAGAGGAVVFIQRGPNIYQITIGG